MAFQTDAHFKKKKEKKTHFTREMNTLNKIQHLGGHYQQDIWTPQTEQHLRTLNRTPAIVKLYTSNRTKHFKQDRKILETEQNNNSKGQMDTSNERTLQPRQKNTSRRTKHHFQQRYMHSGFRRWQKTVIGLLWRHMLTA